MGMRPDGMERWGVVAILKESARLLNYRRSLFLPFYLAFYLSGSLVGIFQIVFLSPSPPPLPYGASFFLRTVPIDDRQGRELGATDPGVASTVVSMTLSLVVYVLGTAGLGAVAYIVAYIYSNEESDSDPDGGSIVKKVFKLLPHAFLRMWVTQLWTFLLIFVLYLFSLMVGGVLYAILSAATGSSNPPLILLLALIPFVAGVLFLTIMFAFAQFIAVLEPANYGREALKRSTKLVKTGRAGTIVAVLLISITFSAISMFPTQRIATGRLPVWEEIVFGAFIAVVNSAFSVYLGVVSVVMYFVYTSRLNAVISSIPEFNTASPDNPYKPLVPGNAVGEP